MLSFNIKTQNSKISGFRGRFIAVLGAPWAESNAQHRKRTALARTFSLTKLKFPKFKFASFNFEKTLISDPNPGSKLWGSVFGSWSATRLPIRLHDGTICSQDRQSGERVTSRNKTDRFANWTVAIWPLLGKSSLGSEIWPKMGWHGEHMKSYPNRSRLRRYFQSKLGSTGGFGPITFKIGQNLALISY